MRPTSIELRPAWEYRTGDGTARSTMHVNPIVVDGRMYITTPSLKAVALDAATGKELWSFDPARYNNGTVIRLRNRGVAYWKGAEGERIFHFVRDRAYAIDARTGALITSFGKGGYIDLREHLGVDPASVALEMTSPGAVYRNLLILGSRVNESYDGSPGHIRAFDTVTGQLRWIFHTIPSAGEFGHDTWTFVEGERYGGANAWGGITIDEQRGWVFAATGSATEDFYGGFRKGANLFANSVLALDAATGERKWHYQTVHHDIWDYDNPPAPILVTITSGGKPRDVVVQLTKMGFTFVLDRETGQPVFPVHEVPVPGSTMPGEAAWPTQPVPLQAGAARPPVAHGSRPDEHHARGARAGAEGVRPLSRRVDLHAAQPGGHADPTRPSRRRQWHGASFDPLLNVLYVNVNDAPTINRLRPVYDAGPAAGATPAQLGRQIYERHCVSCHGADRQGTPPLVPSLVNADVGRQAIQSVVTEGRNTMPAFAHLRPARRECAGGLPRQPGRCRRCGRRRASARPLHDRSVRRLHRSARRASHGAALGHVERHRPCDRRF